MLGASAGWTCTEDKVQRKVPRPAVKGTLNKSQSAAALLQSKSRSRVETMEARVRVGLGRGASSARGIDTRAKADLTNLKLCDGGSGDGGYREWQAHFQAEYSQQQRLSSLAQPRRQRLVDKTLDAVRGAFDPTEGLEIAAANAADELLAQWRTPSEQRAAYESLAKPRAPHQEAEADLVLETRTWAEQQAHCEELARPLAEISVPSTPDALKLLPFHSLARSLAVQQRRCSELAQPRPRSPEVPCESEPSILSAPWREQLAARGNEMVPGEVRKARELLTQMRERADANKEASVLGGSRSRPSSAQRRPPSAGVCRRRKEGQVADPVVLEELKAIVEEVLWVALLQIRSCPSGSSNAKETSTLEDRLGGLLISAVGPALRPVARRVLGPGQGLARRIRSEFPRLAVHLGFRESEDLEPVPTHWTAAEVSAHIEEVRACRDRVLHSDITKTLIPRVGPEIAKQCL